MAILHPPTSNLHPPSSILHPPSSTGCYHAAIAMRIKRIHHVTIAVRDGERARATFEQLFGARAGQPNDVPAFGVRSYDVRIGDDTLQLAAPLQPDSALMRFVERRGEGFYNLALEVEDLDEAVAELASRGVRVSEPIEALPGVRSAFISMAATHGLSIQLVELRHEPEEVESADEVMAAEMPEEAEGRRVRDLTPDEWSDID